jgi:ATP-binding cassette subfamily B multidrug efflux pump
VSTTAVTLLAPWVLRLAVDDLQLGVTRAKLLLYAGAILAIAAAAGVSRFLMRRIIIGASRDIEYDLRNAFFSHLQRLPLAYFHAHRTGDLMSRATNDLSAVRMMVGPAVMYTASTACTFVVALLLMVTLNARLTLMALLPLPFITVVARYFGHAIHERFERIQQQLADLSAVTQETLSGVRVIRAYGQEQHEIERFRRANQEYVDRNRTLITLQGFFYPSMGLFMGIAEMLVLWLGARDVVAGRMTVGELVAFNAYLAMLAWPMIAFGWVTNLLQRGRASWGRMVEVMETPPAIADNETTRRDVRVDDIKGAIELRRLTFSYGGAPVLDDINVSIAPGQTVAIVGRTGAGKTTLLSMLARLHDPPPRTVFIDGIDVRELPLATLRGAIGFVPQEPFLF